MRWEPGRLLGYAWTWLGVNLICLDLWEKMNRALSMVLAESFDSPMPLGCEYCRLNLGGQDGV